MSEAKAAVEKVKAANKTLIIRRDISIKPTSHSEVSDLPIYIVRVFRAVG
ncbi:hypothetical protein VHTUMSATKI_30520 [Vibrio harveyi]|nr:hypothetical protein VH1807_contig00044-0154 [Vibrio harveyi]